MSGREEKKAVLVQIWGERRDTILVSDFRNTSHASKLNRAIPADTLLLAGSYIIYNRLEEKDKILF